MRQAAAMALTLLALSLTACGRPEPIAYAKEQPAGVYPTGLLSGEPWFMVGLRFKF